MPTTTRTPAGLSVGQGLTQLAGVQGEVVQFSPMRGFESVGTESLMEMYAGKALEFQQTAAFPQAAHPLYMPPVSPETISPAIDHDSTPLQIWEGVVVDVDSDSQSMQVSLNAKMIPDAPHTADIELQWVAEQDQELVRPGAVFYLTLYKRTRRGSVSNAQELRFRRLPSWTKSQLSVIDKDSDFLLSKMRTSAVAE